MMVHGVGAGSGGGSRNHPIKSSADLIGISEAMVETAIRSTISEWTRYSYPSYVGLRIIHHDFATGQ
jgi:hypothetical protein